MPFKFEIQDVFPIYVKGITCLVGKLLEGDIHINDAIGIPLQNGTVVPAHVAGIEVNFERVEHLTADQIDKQIELALVHLSREAMASVQLGIVTNFVPPLHAPAAVSSTSEASHRSRKSVWWAFWRGL